MPSFAIATLLPFAGAVLLPLLTAPRARAAGVVGSLVAALCLGLILSEAPAMLEGARHVEYPWIPQLGLQFSVLADGLSLLFALLITGVGLIVFTFATAYLGPDENRRRFFVFLLGFMGSMLGVVLSANLIGLFVFWELTSVTSFLLIGFWHERDNSRTGALKALVITASGGLAMFVGLVMIGLIAGSFEIPVILERSAEIAASPWATPAAILLILGIVTKSAQFPFHLWLPTAMEAPTPVSAYLHAATMVKAGLYLAARLGPAMHEVPIWSDALVVIGLFTMTWCSFLALRQSDLKGLLAFSTVSQLGLILSMLAPAQEETTAAGLFHLLNHGVFKGALFLLVGIIEHAAHTRDVTRLGPLRTFMPRSYILLALAALSMAGVPPLGGFISKEMFLEQVLGFHPLLILLAAIGAAMTAGYCFALAIGLAQGRIDADAPEAQALHDPSPALLWGPAVLVVGALALGLAPQLIGGSLIEAATTAAVGEPLHHHVHLALWHGFGLALLLSVFAVGGGLAIYYGQWRRTAPKPPTLTVDRVYFAFLEALEGWSRALTASYMSGLVWRYLQIILGVGIAGIAAVLLTEAWPGFEPWDARPVNLFEVVAAALVAAAGIGTAMARTRLAAILALGASGYGVALLFALLGAPDLALTQIMVETISVALFLAVFVYLPAYPEAERRRLRPLHLAISLVVGFGTVALVALTRGHRVADSISSYFLENSVAAAGGHNVVNVILVDFRGLDTLGEITVLGVAGLACFALIKRSVKPEESA